MNILIYCLCVDCISQFYCRFLQVLNGGFSLLFMYFLNCKRIDSDREGALARLDERVLVHVKEISITPTRNILIVLGTIMVPDLFQGGGGSVFIVFNYH